MHACAPYVLLQPHSRHSLVEEYDYMLVIEIDCVPMWYKLVFFFAHNCYIHVLAKIDCVDYENIATIMVVIFSTPMPKSFGSAQWQVQTLARD